MPFRSKIRLLEGRICQKAQGRDNFCHLNIRLFTANEFFIECIKTAFTYEYSITLNEYFEKEL